MDSRTYPPKAKRPRRVAVAVAGVTEDLQAVVEGEERLP